MKQYIHVALNTFLAVSCFILLNSCAQTAQLPPVKFTGKYKDKPVSVTIYPDGSKPVEIEYDGNLNEPIEIEL